MTQKKETSGKAKKKQPVNKKKAPQISIPKEYLEQDDEKTIFLEMFADSYIDSEFNYQKAIESLGIEDKNQIQILLRKLPFDTEVRRAISNRLISRGLSGALYYKGVIIDGLHSISSATLKDFYDENGMTAPQNWNRSLARAVRKFKYKDTVMPRDEGEPIIVEEREIELYDPIKAGQALIEYSTFMDDPAKKRLDDKFNSFINVDLNGNMDDVNISHWLKFMIANVTEVFGSKENIDRYMPIFDKIGSLVKSKDYVKSNSVSLEKMSAFFAELQNVLVDAFGDDIDKLERAQENITHAASKIFSNIIDIEEDE